jgi:hypothetical protein
MMLFLKKSTCVKNAQVASDDKILLKSGRIFYA